MKTLRARVQGGRLLLDDPVSLPEGTEVELIICHGDPLDEEDRAHLDQALERSYAGASRGTVSAEDALRKLAALEASLL
jgi:hypothetical protein